MYVFSVIVEEKEYNGQDFSDNLWVSEAIVPLYM